MPRSALPERANRPAASVAWRWGRRAGVAGSLFFLVKGLLWLTVPLALALLRR